jgi:hypothetical protein
VKRLVPLFVMSVSCGGAVEPPPGTPTLQLVTSALSSPVFVTAPPGDMLRLFVVEQGGRVRVLRDTLLTTPFLDLRGKINTGGEEGLLSLAFHPGYATNGRLYVYFTNRDGDIRIVRYTVSTGDPNVADSLSGDTVLAVPHPGESNHNGGLVLFGPDGKLYAGLGDGGGGGDPDGNGQDKQALLGKILRLDVDAGTPYAIPTDNPFATDPNARGEIWAFGLRNPWRFSFDRQTGDLYIADVGQNEWEEVDVAAAPAAGRGVNYGWNVMEGAHCFASCDTTGLARPVLEYSHGDGCSITGGYVYRGTRVPALAGHYLYSDYCTHFVRSFRYVGGQATDRRDRTTQLDPGGSVTSFGEDGRGELYVVVHGGRLYRVVEAP